MIRSLHYGRKGGSSPEWRCIRLRFPSASTVHNGNNSENITNACVGTVDSSGSERMPGKVPKRVWALSPGAERRRRRVVPCRAFPKESIEARGRGCGWRESRCTRNSPPRITNGWNPPKNESFRHGTNRLAFRGWVFCFVLVRIALHRFVSFRFILHCIELMFLLLSSALLSFSFHQPPSELRCAGVFPRFLLVLLDHDVVEELFLEFLQVVIGAGAVPEVPQVEPGVGGVLGPLPDL